MIEAASLLGWRLSHTHIGVGSERGFPGLVLATPGLRVVPELTSERGTPTPGQPAWVEPVASVPGVTAMVAKPSDWKTVESILNGGL